MDAKSKTIKERKAKEQAALLEHLKKIPIVRIACEKTGIGHASYYRWRKEDAKFRKLADEALADGEALITDMSESQLISLIRDKNFAAVHLWLRTHHPKYANKLEIIDHSPASEELTPKQKVAVREALRLAKLGQPKKRHDQ